MAPKSRYGRALAAVARHRPRFCSVVFGTAALAVAAVAVFAIQSCGGDDSRDATYEINESQPIDRAGQPRAGRQISPQEMDSLRVLIRRYRVTREQYWDEKGGVLANDAFEVWYPAGTVTITHGMYALKHLMQARNRVEGMFGRVPEGRVRIWCAGSLKEYKKRAKGEWWQYSRTRSEEIVFQPIGVLVQRGIGAIAVPREYFAWAIDRLSAGRAPAWLANGFASELAGEEKLLAAQLSEFSGSQHRLTLKDIESALERQRDKQRTRLALYAAHRMAISVESRFGRDKLVAVVLAMGAGADRDDAFRTVFARGYNDVATEAVVAASSPRSVPVP